MQDRTRFPSPELDQTSGTVVFKIYEDYPPLVRVFCHVISFVDNSTFGIGHIDVNVQGT